MPTIPKPTTTILFRFSGGLGYCGLSSSGSWPLAGILPACMPGEESAQDIAVIKTTQSANIESAFNCICLPSVQQKRRQMQQARKERRKEASRYADHYPQCIQFVWTHRSAEVSEILSSKRQKQRCSSNCLSRNGQGNSACISPLPSPNVPREWASFLGEPSIMLHMLEG